MPFGSFGLDILGDSPSDCAMARDLIKQRRKAFRVGPLPAGLVNRALGTELEVADVWVSKACHAHIADDHPDDYPVIMANLIDILRYPTYAG